MDDLYFSFYQSPIGILKISSDNTSIISIQFDAINDNQIERINDVIKVCKDQLDEYFDGKRKVFDLPLKPAGTEFQKKVWDVLCNIPFGEISTYNNIAKQLGSEKLNRAVGLANGANPIPIIIPCHRIIGTNGKLTGYAGGLDRKRWLLSHELKYSDKLMKLLF